MQRWSDTVLRVAYTWTKRPEDAQDICQTVLLKLLTHPHTMETQEQERAWVLRVTINACKDLRRSAWFRRNVPLDAAANAAVHLPEPQDSRILQAVQTLPEHYRQAIYLRYYEEYTVDEIASLLNCPASRVSTWLYRGKAKLRSMLGGMYGQQALSE